MSALGYTVGFGIADENGYVEIVYDARKSSSLEDAIAYALLMLGDGFVLSFVQSGGSNLARFTMPDDSVEVKMEVSPDGDFASPVISSWTDLRSAAWWAAPLLDPTIAGHPYAN